MLGSRKITATLPGETLEGSVARGCSQGGVLLPLLWSLVVDELIGLNGNGYYLVCPESNATHFFFSPLVFDKNDILHAAGLKCPAFIHVGARFPARW
jgi:hypothetical protein